MKLKDALMYILLIIAIIIMLNDYIVNQENIEVCGDAWKKWQDTNSSCDIAKIFCHESSVPVPAFTGYP